MLAPGSTICRPGRNVLTLPGENCGPSSAAKATDHAPDGGIPHTASSSSSNLVRPVYCVLGLAVDAIDMPQILRRIETAALAKGRCLISTPNLNFLVNSRTDPEFRESVLDSDLCPADGMPIVWIARLWGLPITERVSGSDIYSALKALDCSGRPLSVFFFGGADDAANQAATSLNKARSGLRCCGVLNPGFVPVNDMSQDDIIDAVNASEADILSVSLGAKKGQLWLHRNHQRLTIPVRVHLGAVINFEAGTVRRAPSTMQRWGLEWLWRIKEEPALWRRYAYDAGILLWLLIRSVLPLAIVNQWRRLRYARQAQDLVIQTLEQHDGILIGLLGLATERNVEQAIKCFQETLTKPHKLVKLDLSQMRAIDQRFLGLLLMFRKELKGQGRSLSFVGVSPAIKRLFRLNGVEFLLTFRHKSLLRHALDRMFGHALRPASLPPRADDYPSK